MPIKKKKKKKKEIGPVSLWQKKRAQATVDITVFLCFPRRFLWLTVSETALLTLLETIWGPSDSMLAVKFPALGSAVTSTDMNPA